MASIDNGVTVEVYASNPANITACQTVTNIEVNAPGIQGSPGAQGPAGISNLSFTGQGSAFVTVSGAWILISGATNLSQFSNDLGFSTSGNLSSVSGVLSDRIFNTGDSLNSKLNTYSGFVSNNFSIVKVTGSNVVLAPNFSGIGGTNVILSGNLVLISGGGNSVTTTINGLSSTVLLTGAGSNTVYSNGQIISVSGVTNLSQLNNDSNFITDSNLSSASGVLSDRIIGTGNNLQTQINSLSSATGGYYPSSNPNNYSTSGNLATTGSNLYNLIVGLSGQSSSSYATITNLYQTGSNLQNQINSLGSATGNYYTKNNESGFLNNLSGLSTGYVQGVSGALQTQLNSLSNNLTSSGQTLDSKINSLSGYSVGNFAIVSNLVSTGSNLYNIIVGLSGQSNLNYATISNLTQTGIILGSKIDSVSGWAASSVNLQSTGQNLQSQINTITSNLTNTGITLGSKIDSLSGFAVANYSSVKITGSNIISAPNFSGIGGLNIILSGNNTVLISGGAGSTVNNTFYVNSGSGTFLYRNYLSSGVSKQFINYPTVLDNNPITLITVRNDYSDTYIACQPSGSNSTGFWAILSNTTPTTGFYLDIMSCNATGTGLATTVIVNNITNPQTISLKTGNYVYQNSDYMVVLTGLNGGTFTLPAAINVNNQVFGAKHAGSGVLVVTGSNSMFLTNNVQSISMNRGDAYFFHSAGTNNYFVY